MSEKTYPVEQVKPYLSKKQVRKVIHAACEEKGLSSSDLDADTIEVRGSGGSALLFHIVYSRASYTISCQESGVGSCDGERDVHEAIDRQLVKFRKGLIVRY